MITIQVYGSEFTALGYQAMKIERVEGLGGRKTKEQTLRVIVIWKFGSMINGLRSSSNREL